MARYRDGYLATGADGPAVPPDNPGATMDRQTDQRTGRSLWGGELSPRQVGVLALCLMVPMSAYYSLAKPLVAVHHGGPAAASLKWTWLLFVSLVIGVGYACFPDRAERSLGSWRFRTKPAGVAICLAAMAAMFATYAMVSAYVRSRVSDRPAVERVAPGAQGGPAGPGG